MQIYANNLSLCNILRISCKNKTIWMPVHTKRLYRLYENRKYQTKMCTNYVTNTLQQKKVKGNDQITTVHLEQPGTGPEFVPDNWLPTLASTRFKADHPLFIHVPDPGINSFQFNGGKIHLHLDYCISHLWYASLCVKIATDDVNTMSTQHLLCLLILQNLDTVECYRQKKLSFALQVPTYLFQ